MSARSSALNSVRRALWLKTWSGDSTLKVKCGIPFTGDLLFGQELDLDRMADMKAFPQKVVQQRNFHPFQQAHKEKSDSKTLEPPEGKRQRAAF